MTLFDNEFENISITRIVKFGRLCEKMGYTPVLGFSGGKDSQVCYHLARRAGITFKAVFNHSFESAVTLAFIRQYYPDVVWRREVKQGFLENIQKNHKGMLPTVERAYCCQDYKHNPKFVDKASIVGVRGQESAKRAKRKTVEFKNKTLLKKNKIVYDYFEERCVGSGAAHEIQLKPIIDWTDENVWDYIKKYNIPVNPEYNISKRVGCVICPKANFSRNYIRLLLQPKLIDAIIKARDKAERTTPVDWIITGENNKDYSDNKPLYICKWLNHSFRPFTKKQEKLVEMVKKKYEEITKQ